MMATARQHEELAGAINLLINARHARIKGGNINAALNAERQAEHILHRLFTAEQVDELMTAWEGSFAINPLELEDWRLILDPE